MSDTTDPVGIAIEEAEETERTVSPFYAMQQLEKHVDSAPEDVRLFMALMEHAANAGDHPLAFDYADRAARLPDKNTPIVAQRIVNCMLELGRADEAVSMLTGLRGAYPGLIRGTTELLCASLMNAGRPAEAVGLLEGIMDEGRDLGVMWTSYGGVVNAAAKSMPASEIDARIDRVTRLMEHAPDEGSAGDRRLFARGEMFEARKDYAAALEDFLEAKERADARIGEGENDRIDNAHAVTQFATEKWIDALRENCAISTDRPVFITGMPRSGTSLTEQILSRHDSVGATGETLMPFNHLTSIAGSAAVPGLPHRLTRYTTPFLREGLTHYLGLLNRWDPNPARMTNKTPGHFHLMGVLHGVYGGARTIVTDRDPLDNVIGIFRRYLSEDGYGYAFDMGKIANAIRAKEIYLEHWAELFGERMMRVSLEEMSEDPDPVLREVQDFLDVPREETGKLVTPSSSDRSVKTFSTNQVRDALRDPRSEWMRAYRDLLPAYLKDRVMQNLP